MRIKSNKWLNIHGGITIKENMIYVKPIMTVYDSEDIKNIEALATSISCSGAGSGVNCGSGTGVHQCSCGSGKSYCRTKA